MFLFSGEGREVPTLLGPSEAALSMGRNRDVTPNFKMETDPVSETPCFLVL
jgi:hypothetical protein